MGGSGGGKAPPMPAPVPQVVEADASKKSNDLRRKMLANLGRQGTILVPNTLGVSDTNKNTTLG